jgi:hypothetical protein
MMSVLDALADAGAFVAADDYAAIGRRVNRHHPAALDDPFAALAELSFAAPPCSTRQSNQIARADHLESLLESSGALGVLLHTVKFCEPELFDLPVLRRRLEVRGVPVLQLESGAEAELSGQALTRIEAFVDDARRRLPAGDAMIARACATSWPGGGRVACRLERGVNPAAAAPAMAAPSTAAGDHPPSQGADGHLLLPGLLRRRRGPVAGHQRLRSRSCGPTVSTVYPENHAALCAARRLA